MADRSTHYRAYEIHVGFAYDGDADGIRAALEPVFGDRLAGVTTEGADPATAVILVRIPHRRARPTIHHDGDRLDVAAAVEAAGFVHERAVPLAEYRHVLEE